MSRRGQHKIYLPCFVLFQVLAVSLNNIIISKLVYFAHFPAFIHLKIMYGMIIFNGKAKCLFI